MNDIVQVACSTLNNPKTHYRGPAASGAIVQTLASTVQGLSTWATSRFTAREKYVEC